MATIAVVDDHAGVRSFCTRVLESSGHRALVFEDAAELLRQVEDQAPDAVVLDLFMPPPDGLETLKALRAMHPELPVVAISGGATGYGAPEPFLAVAKHMGAVQTLAKPLDARDLMDAVNAALAQRSGPAPQ